MSRFKALSTAGLLVAAAFVVACSETVPSAPDDTIPTAEFDLIVPAAEDGVVKVCKDAASGTFQFTVSQDPTTEGTLQVASPFSLNAEECVTVWTDDATTTPADPTTTVTVTETVPAGFQLDAITITGNPNFPSTDLATATATVTVNAFHGAVIVFANSEVPPPGDEGCTPGFWKNHTDLWTGFSTGDDFDTVFGVDLFDPDIDLETAINLKGGGLNAMARHAVAALLSAASPDVDAALSESEVIAIVQAAEASGDFNSAKDELEAANVLGSPGFCD